MVEKVQKAKKLNPDPRETAYFRFLRLKCQQKSKIPCKPSSSFCMSNVHLVSQMLCVLILISNISSSLCTLLINSRNSDNLCYTGNMKY